MEPWNSYFSHTASNCWFVEPTHAHSHTHIWMKSESWWCSTNTYVWTRMKAYQCRFLIIFVVWHLRISIYDKDKFTVYHCSHICSFSIDLFISLVHWIAFNSTKKFKYNYSERQTVERIIVNNICKFVSDQILLFSLQLILMLLISIFILYLHRSELLFILFLFLSFIFISLNKMHRRVLWCVQASRTTNNLI